MEGYLNTICYVLCSIYYIPWCSGPRRGIVGELYSVEGVKKVERII
jgi:hypothetical protein